MPEPRLSPTTPQAMPKRQVRTLAGIIRTVVLVLLAVVVVAAGALLAVPPWRAAVLPTATVTHSSGPPATWRAPQTAAPPELPLSELDATVAPSGKALSARIPTLAAQAAATPGLVVVDPATSKTLIGRADRGLMPASTMKVLTSLAALEALGSGRTFATSVTSPRNAVVILRGGGDPFLRDARAPGRASLQQLAVMTAEALKKAGTTKVTLGYDASLFGGPSWHRHWTDNYRYSVAPITALMVNGGFAPSTGKAEKNPSAAAAARFAKRLTAQGITVRATKAMTTPEGASELAAMSSAPVEQLIEQTLRYSDNVGAETLARQVALATDRPGSFAGAEAAVRATLKQLGVWKTGMVIDDNCGLSRENRVTPGALAGAMRLVLTDAAFHTLILGLPVGGVSGTLLERFDDHNERAGRGVVRAKTGSLRDVTALAGYLITADGSPLVFAIVANGVRQPLAVKNWIDRTTAAWASCGCG